MTRCSIRVTNVSYKLQKKHEIILSQTFCYVAKRKVSTDTFEQRYAVLVMHV